MWPIQLAFRLLISCRIFLCSLIVILLHFSHDRSNWSSPSFSITTFQNVVMLNNILIRIFPFVSSWDWIVSCLDGVRLGVASWKVGHLPVTYVSCSANSCLPEVEQLHILYAVL
jgi:hypothetical protein